MLWSTYIVNSCWLFSWPQKITRYYTTTEDAYSLIEHVTVDGFQQVQNVIHCCVSLQCELLSSVPSYGHHLFLFHVFWTQLYSDWYALHKKKLLHFWVTTEHTKTYKHNTQESTLHNSRLSQHSDKHLGFLRYDTTLTGNKLITLWMCLLPASSGYSKKSMKSENTYTWATGLKHVVLIAYEFVRKNCIFLVYATLKSD